MRIMGLAWIAAAALSIVVAQGDSARAAPGFAGGLRPALDDVSPVEPAQFLFDGRNYCFYLNGWHGPGWYWCGYANRRGLGWGGPRGWHGWQHGSRPHNRPHGNRPAGRPSHGKGKPHR